MTVTYPEHVFVEETKSALPVMAGLHPLRSSPSQGERSRLAGGAVTIGIHVLAAVIFYFGTGFAKLASPPAVMSVSILKEPAQADAPVAPPKVQQVRPDMPQFEAPDIQILVSVPTAITVAPQAPIAPAAQPPSLPDSPPPMSSEAQNNYYSKLLGQLNRHKRYPAAAKTKRREGVVKLHFIMNTVGQVLVAEIAGSSGVPELDAEAIELVHRAQPLPAIPPGFGKDRIDIVVPIEFFLR